MATSSSFEALLRYKIHAEYFGVERVTTTSTSDKIAKCSGTSDPSRAIRRRTIHTPGRFIWSADRRLSSVGGCGSSCVLHFCLRACCTTRAKHSRRVSQRRAILQRRNHPLSTLTRATGHILPLSTTVSVALPHPRSHVSLPSHPSQTVFTGFLVTSPVVSDSSDSDSEFLSSGILPNVHSYTRHVSLRSLDPACWQFKLARVLCSSNNSDNILPLTRIPRYLKSKRLAAHRYIHAVEN